jgi:hypothetical protein
MFDEKTLTEMGKDYYNGLSIEKIAKKFNYSYNSVRTSLMKRNFRKMNEICGLIKRHNERLELYKMGLSDKEIAIKLNSERTTIKGWRRYYHLPPNRARKPLKTKRFSEQDARYIAGFVDGEGYVGILYRRLNDTLCPIIEVCNTNIDVIRWLKEKAQSGKIVFYPKQQKNNSKESYRFLINNITDCKFFAEQIVNYSIVKKEALKKLIIYCNSRLEKPAHTHYSKDEYDIYNKIKEINKRGIIRK